MKYSKWDKKIIRGLSQSLKFLEYSYYLSQKLCFKLPLLLHLQKGRELGRFATAKARSWDIFPDDSGKNATFSWVTPLRRYMSNSRLDWVFWPPQLRVEPWEKNEVVVFQSLKGSKVFLFPGGFQNDDNLRGQESHTKRQRAPGAVSTDPSLPPSFLPRPARQRFKGRWCFHQVFLPGHWSHPPLPLQAQPLISADRGWREPGIQLLSPGSTIHQPGRQEVGVGGRRAAEAAPPPPPGPLGPAAPGGASRTLERSAAPPPGLFVLPRGALRPRADVDPAEWQEISQGFPPPRAPGQSAPRGRCWGAAHTHIPESTPHTNILSPAHAPLPAPPFRRHALLLGAISWSGPGPGRLGALMLLSKVKVKWGRKETQWSVGEG